MTLEAGDWQAAVAHLQAGRLVEAEAMARAALIALPGHVQWLSLQAAALAYQGKSAEAATIFRRLTDIEPGVADHWSNLGNAQCDAGDHAAAIHSLGRALELDGDSVFAHAALARACRASGLAVQSLRHATRAVELRPADPALLLLRGSIQVWLDDWDAGHADLVRLSGLRLDTRQCCQCADLALQMNLFPEARQAFDAAIRIQPGNVDAWLGRGLLEERVNALDEAGRCLAEAERLLPQGGPRPPRLLQLQARIAFREKDFPKASALLEQLLAEAGGPRDPMLLSQLLFDLGSSLDQSGETERAWQAFTRAHEARNMHLRQASQRGNPANDLRHILATPAPGRIDVVTAPPSDGQRDPVFVVGFPRSGTTLLEQMLDAQPELASFDEKPFLQRLILGLRQRGLRYPEDLAALASDAGLIAAQRQEYAGYVRKAVEGLGSRRPVDKNPLNILRLPLVSVLMPGARVIVAVRHPCDVVLSCYMQVFRTPALEASFSSLEATAALYSEVMAYWRQVRDGLGLPVMLNRYEDLVADPVAQSGRLADFLGIARDSWQHDAIAHARGKSGIRTPSYAQVAEPIHQRASGRWRRYRAHFSDDTLAKLEPWAREFGYELG